VENAGSLGGFITFPGGNYVYDPASEVFLPGYKPPSRHGLTYDMALRRWLPVHRESVTPDGLRWVLPTQPVPGTWSKSIVVVERDGSTRTLGMPDPGFFSILSAEAEGIYVNRWPGLLLIGWNGSSRWITHAGYWQAIRGGDAFGTAKPLGESGVTYPILRLDLETGDAVEVFARQGTSTTVAGFGSGGEVVVEARTETTDEVWLVGASQTLLMSNTSLFSVNNALSDRHGSWIATTKGLYLYTASAGLQLASTAAQGFLASSCN
jgi:hypothetical protein